MAKRGPPVPIDALTLVTRRHRLTRCRQAVRRVQRHSPPPLPKGPGGAPRVYSAQSLLLIAVLRPRWRRGYREMHDGLVAWPAVALACGRPTGPGGAVRVPRTAQMGTRAARAGAPPGETLFVLAVRDALRRRLSRARALIIESAPLNAWRQRDPDAPHGHAPAQHPTRFRHG
jgi:hypothetical protein